MIKSITSLITLCYELQRINYGETPVMLFTLTSVCIAGMLVILGIGFIAEKEVGMCSRSHRVAVSYSLSIFDEIPAVIEVKDCSKIYREM